jgi:uncharacterized membrane protein
MVDLIRANWHGVWPDQWKAVAVAAGVFAVVGLLWVACRVMEAVEEYHRTERAIEILRTRIRHGQEP